VGRMLEDTLHLLEGVPSLSELFASGRGLDAGRILFVLRGTAEI